VEIAASKALLAGKSVVIDRMHLDTTQRAHFVNVAEAEEQLLDIPVHVVVLTPPKDTLAERVRHRQNHSVTGEQGAKMAVSSAGKLQLPSYKEGIHLWSASSTVEGAARLVHFYRSVGAEDSEGEAMTMTAIPESWSVANDRIMPTIALGTMGLGRKTATEVVSLASKLGFTAFDTAPTYKNEDKVGEGMKGDGDASFCILKAPKRATTPELVRSEFVESLSKLDRKTANLLLLHWPCDVIAGGTLKEVWKEMEQLVQEGLVQMIGVCNFSAQALGMLLPHCTIRPVVNQVERHPLLPQWELLDFCAKKDIMLQAHSPLGQGSSDLFEHAVVKEVAVKNKCSPAQVVLRWNLQQGVAVVPKCSSEEHMQQVRSVLASDSCQLSPADVKALNTIGETKRFVAPPFMYGTGPYCWGKHAPKYEK
jgi:diketogulonate reductase-like aldo/keto reductase